MCPHHLVGTRLRLGWLDRAFTIKFSFSDSPPSSAVAGHYASHSSEQRSEFEVQVILRVPTTSDSRLRALQSPQGQPWPPGEILPTRGARLWPSGPACAMKLIHIRRAAGKQAVFLATFLVPRFTAVAGPVNPRAFTQTRGRLDGTPLFRIRIGDPHKTNRPRDRSVKRVCNLLIVESAILSLS